MTIEQLKANIRQVRVEQNKMNYRPAHLDAQAVTALISEFLCRLAEHTGQDWDEKKGEWKDK